MGRKSNSQDARNDAADAGVSLEQKGDSLQSSPPNSNAIEDQVHRSSMLLDNHATEARGL